MTFGFCRCCFATVISVLLVSGFIGAANAESGFHAQSRDLPATTNSYDRGCSELTGKKTTPGFDRTVVPADVERVGPENFPVIRFDLGLGKRQKNRYISPGLKNSRLRARNLTAGEVSVDTYNGEVALDGQALTRSKNRYGC